MNEHAPSSDRRQKNSIWEDARWGRIPHGNENGPALLSRAQERLWFLDQLVPNNPFYNCDIVVPLGAVDAFAMRRAFTMVLKRHEQLRRAFIRTDDGPRQAESKQPTPELVLTDLRQVPPEKHERALQVIVSTLAREPFDLTAGNLIRASLIRLDPAHHLLVLVIHHIVCDGWSLNVLTRDLWECYAAVVEGRPERLDPLPITYTDFANWQRSWLSGDLLNAQLEYWRTQLAGVQDLSLPTDRLRPPTPSYSGKFLSVQLAPGLTDVVRRLAAETGTTTFMILLAAYAAMLSRFSGDEDLVIGAPIANRTRVELEGIVGFFVNTLVLRVSLSGDPTFRELLARVRDQVLDAFQHQDLPFERLVQELRPDRDLSRNPLVQVVAQHFELAPAGTPGHVSAPDAVGPELARGTAKFDLRLDTWDAGDVIRGQFEYSLDLFDDETARGFLDTWIRLLQELAPHPDRQVGDVDLCSPAERQLMIERWNDTSRPYDSRGGVHERVRRQAATRPNASAVVDAGHITTYRELWDLSGGIVDLLLHHGITPGALVAVSFTRGLLLVAAELAVLRVGGTYLPLDPSYPVPRLEQILEDGRPEVLLTYGGLMSDTTTPGIKRILVDELTVGDTDLCIGADPENPACLMYTSGSTGRPKGVLIPHRGILRLVSDTQYVRLGPHDVVGFGSNVSFDASNFEVWAALANGCCLVVLDRDTMLSPHRLRDMIRSSGMTVLFVTTALWVRTIEEVPDAFATLDTLMTGGSVFDISAGRRMFGAGAPRRFLNMYGPTENTTFATAHLLDGPPDPQRPLPIGTPVANTTAYVVDDRARPVPVGFPGELWVGGDGVALGYHGRPDLTAGAFIEDPFARKPGRLLYRTGDRVRRRRDGALDFIGRKDRQVKIRGFRVELAEVELALRSHPLVGDVIVLAKPDLHDDTQLVAYVRTQDPSESSIASAEVRTSEDALVDQWRRFYDKVLYDDAESHGASTNFPDSENISGWISSYTGLPLSREIMREQVAATSDLVLSSAPNRVLDVGCGSGLIAYRVASRIHRYVGTDLSPRAVAALAAGLDSLGAERVRVECLGADQCHVLGEGDFDVVLLNSVVQYFPSAAYLERVLTQAVGLTSPGGRIIIGDMRFLPLLTTFHASVAAVKAKPGQPKQDFERRVRSRIERENELAVSVEFFHELASRTPQITSVSVSPKRGRGDSELTRFRADVVLRVGGTRPLAPEQEEAWGGRVATVDEIAALLRRSAPDSVVVRGIPNARLAGSGGIDPEDLWALSNDHAYDVHLAFTPGCEATTMDLLAVRRQQGGVERDVLFPEPNNSRRHGPTTTDPARGNFLRSVVPELRDYAAANLPDYMRPAAWVLVSTFPVDPNGKVDVAALPPVDDFQANPLDASEAPRDDLEQSIAEVISTVLGLSRVGRHESFFVDLGGDSLTATKVVSRLRRRLGVEIPIRTMFEQPTVAGLADSLSSYVSAAKTRGNGIGPALWSLTDADVDELTDEQVEEALAVLDSFNSRQEDR